MVTLIAYGKYRFFQVFGRSENYSCQLEFLMGISTLIVDIKYCVFIVLVSFKIKCNQVWRLTGSKILKVPTIIIVFSYVNSIFVSHNLVISRKLANLKMNNLHRTQNRAWINYYMIYLLQNLCLHLVLELRINKFRWFGLTIKNVFTNVELNILKSGVNWFLSMCNNYLKKLQLKYLQYFHLKHIII